MKFRTRMLAGVTVVAIAASVATIATESAGGAAARPSTTTTFAVGGDHVVCSTLTGTIAFAPKLSFAGATTGAETATIKGAVNGCVDSDKPLVGLFSGTVTGVVHTNNGTNCTALFGPQAATLSTSTLTVVWKPAKLQAFTPVDGVTLKPTSTVHLNGDVGAFFTVQDDNAAGNATPNEGTWTATAYGAFQFGSQYGGATTAMSGGTGDFTGGEATINGSVNTATQFDIATSATLCSGAGIAKEAFGIGQVTLG